MLIILGGLAPLLAALGLGRLALRNRNLPEVIVFAAGAAMESIGIFLLLWLGAARAPVLFIVMAACLYGLRGWRPLLSFPEGWIWRSILAIYGLLYLVQALAPEIQPDGMTYHLGLTREYARTGALSPNINFFSVLPQGMEMLFVPAYHIGGHSAAKLVSFGFTLALIPAFVLLGRKLGLPETVSATACMLLFAAPVVGITGTSTYNDVALVFFLLASSWALIERHHFVAGLLAGFCYAVKVNAILVPAAIGLWLLWRVRRRVIAFAAGAALTVLPWMARNWSDAGNPLAPLMNALFPNPNFHVTMERLLAESWSRTAVPWWRMPWELTCGGGLDGLFGPAFLLAPLALLAVRKPAGRGIVAAAAVLTIPFYLNHGARFLMPSAALVTFAMALALPARAVAGVALVQAILCWPAAVTLYASPHAWRFRDIPWKAALRLEPERVYLDRKAWEPKLARMLDELVPPGKRTFSLMDVAEAYTDRQVVGFWKSAEGERFLDTIRIASEYAANPLFEQRAEWSPQVVTRLRFRLASPGHAPEGMEWCMHEVRLLLGSNRIYTSPQWSIHAWPARFDGPLALDGNTATRWRTWQPMQPGMFFELRFDRPYRLSAAELVSHTPVYGVRVGLDAMGTDGKWRSLSPSLPAVRLPIEDLRLQATRYLKRSGIDYMLVPESESGAWQLARFFTGKHAEWGMDEVNQHGFVRLYRIR